MAVPAPIDFVFDDDHTGLGDQRDHILDFSHAQGDKIDVSWMDADRSDLADQDFVWRGTGAFTDVGQLRYAVSGDNLIVQGNNEGDLHADFAIVLSHVDVGLVASDFIF